MLKSPDNAKKRLAEAIGALAPAAARHLWSCTLEDANAWHGPVWFAPAESSDLEWLRGELGTDARIERQRGGNLGQRINRLDRRLRQRGADRLIFVGTDCPSMDPGYLRQAATRLEHADAVLGPATDGGVVLMGARRTWPDLGSLAWSTDRLGAELAGLCARRGWTVESLTPREDVDTVHDLLATANTMNGDPRPARRDLLKWLNDHRQAL